MIYLQQFILFSKKIKSDLSIRVASTFYVQRKSFTITFYIQQKFIFHIVKEFHTLLIIYYEDPSMIYPQQFLLFSKKNSHVSVITNF